MDPVGWLMIALLIGAVAAVIGAEWPRLSARYGNEARHRRERAKQKAQLKLLRTEEEEFAASVARDLDQLPTIEETDRKR
jgi:cell division protein FtsB